MIRGLTIGYYICAPGNGRAMAWCEDLCAALQVMRRKGHGWAVRRASDGVVLGHVPGAVRGDYYYHGAAA